MSNRSRIRRHSIQKEAQEEDEDDDDDDEDEESNQNLLDVIIRDYLGNNSEEEAESPDPSQPESFKKVVDKGVTVVIGFIAGFITDLLLKEDETAELTIMILLVYAIWFTIDQFVREYINMLWVIQKNSAYRDAVIAMVDLVSYLGIYEITKLGLDLLNTLWESSSIDVGEAFVSLFSICFSLYAVFYTQDHLSR